MGPRVGQQLAVVSSATGAPARTSTVHTLVPAVTNCREPGDPLVTTCSGSWSGTASTVYGQVPEHSGPVVAVTETPAVSSEPCRRTTEITWAALGRPLHGTT